MMSELGSEPEIDKMAKFEEKRGKTAFSEAVNYKVTRFKLVKYEVALFTTFDYIRPKHLVAPKLRHIRPTVTKQNSEAKDRQKTCEQTRSEKRLNSKTDRGLSMSDDESSDEERRGKRRWSEINKDFKNSAGNSSPPLAKRTRGALRDRVGRQIVEGEETPRSRMTGGGPPPGKRTQSSWRDRQSSQRPYIGGASPRGRSSPPATRGRSPTRAPQPGASGSEPQAAQGATPTTPRPGVASQAPEIVPALINSSRWRSLEAVREETIQEWNHVTTAIYGNEWRALPRDERIFRYGDPSTYILGDITDYGEPQQNDRRITLGDAVRRGRRKQHRQREFARLRGLADQLPVATTMLYAHPHLYGSIKRDLCAGRAFLTGNIPADRARKAQDAWVEMDKRERRPMRKPGDSDAQWKAKEKYWVDTAVIDWEPLAAPSSLNIRDDYIARGGRMVRDVPAFFEDDRVRRENWPEVYGPTMDVDPGEGPSGGPCRALPENFDPHTARSMNELMVDLRKILTARRSGSEPQEDARQRIVDSLQAKLRAAMAKLGSEPEATPEATIDVSSSVTPSDKKKPVTPIVYKERPEAEATFAEMAERGLVDPDFDDPDDFDRPTQRIDDRRSRRTRSRSRSQSGKARAWSYPGPNVAFDESQMKRMERNLNPSGCKDFYPGRWMVAHSRDGGSQESLCQEVFCHVRAPRYLADKWEDTDIPPMPTRSLKEARMDLQFMEGPFDVINRLRDSNRVVLKFGEGGLPTDQQTMQYHLNKAKFIQAVESFKEIAVDTENWSASKLEGIRIQDRESGNPQGLGRDEDCYAVVHFMAPGGTEVMVKSLFDGRKNRVGGCDVPKEILRVLKDRQIRVLGLGIGDDIRRLERNGIEINSWCDVHNLVQLIEPQTGKPMSSIKTSKRHIAELMDMPKIFWHRFDGLDRPPDGVAIQIDYILNDFSRSYRNWEEVMTRYNIYDNVIALALPRYLAARSMTFAKMSEHADVVRHEHFWLTSILEVPSRRCRPYVARPRDWSRGETYVNAQGERVRLRAFTAHGDYPGFYRTTEEVMTDMDKMRWSLDEYNLTEESRAYYRKYPDILHTTAQPSSFVDRSIQDGYAAPHHCTRCDSKDHLANECQASGEDLQCDVAMCQGVDHNSGCCTLLHGVCPQDGMIGHKPEHHGEMLMTLREEFQHAKRLGMITSKLYDKHAAYTVGEDLIVRRKRADEFEDLSREDRLK